MKKMDFLLIAVILLAAAGLYFSGLLRPTKEGGFALVNVDGKEYKRFPLDTDAKYEIIENGQKNVLEIRDGHADMTDASCKDKLCVKQKTISLLGETIVCLPNRVVIEVTGVKKTEIDGKTG